MQKYYIFLNLGPAAGPAQAYTIVLQLPIIETRAEVLLGLARADGRRPGRASSVESVWQCALHGRRPGSHRRGRSRLDEEGSW